MTHNRKNFNYRTATVTEIVEHFKTSSKQAIYAVRNTWKDDEQMAQKLAEAYKLYRVEKIMAE